MFDRSYLCMNEGMRLVVCDGGVTRPVSEIRVHTKTADRKKVKLIKDVSMQAPVLAMLDRQAALGNIAHTFLQDDMDIHALHVEFKDPFDREFFVLRNKSLTIEQVFEVEIRYLLPA